MTTHTPGPWANSGPDAKSGQPDEWIYGGSHRARIAKVQFGLNYGQDIDAETAANAQLIAAAPELLAALEALRNEVAGKPRPQILITLLGDADRAIARAKGE